MPSLFSGNLIFMYLLSLRLLLPLLLDQKKKRKKKPKTQEHNTICKAIKHIWLELFFNIIATFFILGCLKQIWWRQLFAFYIFSLRLDTSSHSLPLVIPFVNKYNTVDSALAGVSFPEVCLRMLLADRGALHSNTGCRLHGRCLRPAMELRARTAASPGFSALAAGALSGWTAQLPNVHRDPGEGKQEHLEKEARMSSKIYCCSGWG